VLPVQNFGFERVFHQDFLFLGAGKSLWLSPWEFGAKPQTPKTKKPMVFSFLYDKFCAEKNETAFSLPSK
jgi:hypothetical protein